MSRIALALATAVLFGTAGIASPTWADDIPPLGFKKALEDESDRRPDSTPAVI